MLPGSDNDCITGTGAGVSTPSTAGRGSSQVQVLARYVDLEGQIAAVRCRVGQGVAVLVGTHPELDASWLQRAPPPEDPSTARHVQALIDTLVSSHTSRAAFWNMLLSACCADFRIDDQLDASWH